MGLDELRARLDNLLSRQGLSEDRRAQASRLHDAMIEFKTALAVSREARVVTERELAAERRQLDDAARRGALAEGIGDAETARIAAEFLARHRGAASCWSASSPWWWTRSPTWSGSTRGWPPGSRRRARPADSRRPRCRPMCSTTGSSTPLKARADREAAELAVKAQLELLKKKLNKP